MCFNRLGFEEFRPLVEFLTAQREDAYKYLTSAADLHTVYRLQGKVQALNEILGLVARARSELDKSGG